MTGQIELHLPSGLPLLFCYGRRGGYSWYELLLLFLAHLLCLLLLVFDVIYAQIHLID